MNHPEKYSKEQRKEIIALLEQDRGKCVYCNKKLSMMDSLMSGDVCEKCVRRNHARAVGRLR